MGPSGLDRSCSTIRSSVRSHHIVGSQPDLPWRHHCRPAALPFGLPARPPRPVWPHALARGGRSAHLAGLRSTRSQLPSQPDPSGRHPEQSQRAAPSRSCFFCGDRLEARRRGLHAANATAQGTHSGPMHQMARRRRPARCCKVLGSTTTKVGSNLFQPNHSRVRALSDVPKRCESE